LAGVGQRRHSRGNAEQWELDLVRKVAATFRTNDPAGLESDLMLRLFQLKHSPPARIVDWKKLLYTALRNKARNWVRDERLRERDVLSLDAPIGRQDEDDVPDTLEDRLRSPEVDPVVRAALARLWDELTPDQRALWDALGQADGNQAQAARRLGKHRNTVRSDLRRIQALLQRR
jgi:RNA polymerase sigma factor (sigma-70 family)